MSDQEITIRLLCPNERLAWEPLWRGYLDYYQSTQQSEATEVSWRRIHDPAEAMFALGAYIDGTMQGIVHYLFHRTFWAPEDYCYLQDLFVAENARRHGLGRAMIEAVVEKALEAGASRVYWLTQEDNHTARALYDTVSNPSGFIQYRRSF